MDLGGLANHQGPAGLPYPYGTTYAYGRCVDDKTWIAPDWSLLASWPSQAAEDEAARILHGNGNGSAAGAAAGLAGAAAGLGAMSGGDGAAGGANLDGAVPAGMSGFRGGGGTAKPGAKGAKAGGTKIKDGPKAAGSVPPFAPDTRPLPDPKDLKWYGDLRNPDGSGRVVPGSQVINRWGKDFTKQWPAINAQRRDLDEVKATLAKTMKEQADLVRAASKDLSKTLSRLDKLSGGKAHDLIKKYEGLARDTKLADSAADAAIHASATDKRQVALISAAFSRSAASS